MITNNPFSEISELISPIIMQGFVVTMVSLVIFGTLLDIIHKNARFDFGNSSKI